MTELAVADYGIILEIIGFLILFIDVRNMKSKDPALSNYSAHILIRFCGVLMIVLGLINQFSFIKTPIF